MSLERIAHGLTGGENLGRHIPPELSDGEYIKRASEAARKEAETLLRLHGQIRRWNPIVQGVMFAVDAVVLMGAPALITPFASTRLNTSVASGEYKATISIDAGTAKDPSEEDEIEIGVSGIGQKLHLPKTGSGFYRFSGLPSEHNLTRAEAEAYNNLLGVVRACYHPTPRAQSLVCIDKTDRRTVFPLFWSRPAIAR